MVNKNLLIHATEQEIQRGQILQCPVAGEEDIFLMVCEVIGEETYQLLIINGYKAGLSYCILPREAISIHGYGINTKWLIKNWSTWGVMHSSIEKVLLLGELNYANI